MSSPSASLRSVSLSWSLRCGLVAGLLLVGCKQDQGERCEIDEDCSSDLICDFTNTTSGVCSPRAMTGAGGSTGTGGTAAGTGGTGAGGSSANDARSDAVDAPTNHDATDATPDSSETGADAPDARDGQAG
jgi:hypothetical protein